MKAWQLFGSVGIVVSALAMGCNNSNIGGGTDCTDPTNCTTDPNPTQAEWTSLQVMPAQATLASQDGAKPTQQFTVIGQRANGTLSDPLSGTFSLPLNNIGTIEPSTGVFTATGEVGGTVSGTVTVISNGVAVSGTFQVTVNVNKSILVPGAPSDAASHFTGTPTLDVSKSAAIVYPLNGVVMPQNVYPADIQWTNGVMGDIYRVTITKPNFTVTAYTLHSGGAFKYDYLPSQTVWGGAAQSSPDSDATLTVDRYEAATQKVWSGTPVKMTFVKGSLLGSIYYWEIQNANRGRILRINDGTNVAVDFMPTPPTTPIGNSNCVGCHSISRDGRYMVGRLGPGNNVSGIFDLTADLSGNPAPTRYQVSGSLQQFFFSSWSPDSSRLIVNDDLTLRLINTANGAEVIPVAGALPPKPATYANWSPDGKTIAYVANANEWGDDATVGDLSVLPVTGTDSFGTPTLIHKANSVAGSTEDSFPSWSPDSKWLAFQNGGGSRSNKMLPGALYLASPDGKTNIRMTNATGGNAGTETVYFSNFSPFNVGGYYFITFITHRAYGNGFAGTAARALPRQQLWIAAVKNNPQPGEDPSCVPYWLPGQSTVQQNISAIWTPQACRKDTDSCTVSSQCCGGVCSGGTCVPPPVAQCRQGGQTCGGSGCCAGLSCDAATHVCTGSIG